MNEDKAILRAQMRQLLRDMTAEERQAYSDEICERVLEMIPWAEAQSIVLFTPLPSEPLITPLQIDCKARKVSCGHLAQNPKSDADLHLPDEIDLILVPGLAFSRDGHRLGRGGGFFDRLLAGRAKSAFKLGICFEFQIVDRLPVEPPDVLVDAVITNVA